MPSRSPLSRLPGVALEDPGAPKGDHWHKVTSVLRGRVTEVRKTVTGNQPSFVFSVAPVVGGMASGEAGNIIRAIMLQPGFSRLDDTSTTPTGIVYVPEVGSLVRVCWDGTQWCIDGFYTGPVPTLLERGQDAEGRAIGYNPGIETGRNRMTGVPGWELPHWSFGLEPGDVILGKGPSRVKLSQYGVVVGADLHCARFYKNDGGILERCAEREERMLGYWFRHSFRRGVPEASNAHRAAPHLADIPEDTAVYQCELIEASPLYRARQPYLLRQAGHVSRSFLDLGRSSIYATPSGQQTAIEARTKDFVVKREALIQPLDGVDTPATQRLSKELDPSRALGYELYDLQVDADGSFRLRSGNRTRKVGAQGKAATRELDLSIDFDAQTLSLDVRLGQAGTTWARVQLKADDVNNALVRVEAANLEAEARNSAKIKAKKITLEASEVEVKGQLKVTESATVQKDLKAAGDVLARALSQAISLARHTHNHGGSAGVTQTPNP